VVSTITPLPIPAYAPRLTQSLGCREQADWMIKLIGMSATAEPPTEAEVDAAVEAATALLPPADRTHGMAFLIVHAGTEALWGILGWWELDILYLRTLRADLGTTASDSSPTPPPPSFTRVAPDGPTACVWELEAVDHERRAWIKHVLSHPDLPEYPSYLADCCGEPRAETDDV
jgi:hypothetical protein